MTSLDETNDPPSGVVTHAANESSASAPVFPPTAAATSPYSHPLTKGEAEAEPPPDVTPDSDFAKIQILSKMTSSVIPQACMLNAPAVGKFLTLNVNEWAEHLTMFSEFGQLMGIDDVLDTSEYRSFVAMVAFTWTNYEKALRERGTVKGARPVQHVKVLATTHKIGEPRVLEGMTVAWGKWAAVVKILKPRVRLAAILPLNAFIGEKDPVGKKLAALAAAEVEKTDGFATPGPPDEGGNDPSEAVDAEPVSKIRILECRAEAIAAEIYKQWSGPLAKDFH